MRCPAYHRDQRRRLNATMTPMIDVIFQLMVFFVCTASFQAAEETLPANLSLPGTVSSQQRVDLELEDLGEIVVEILWREGRVAWRIGQRELSSLAEVRGVLESVANKVGPDVPVIFDADGQVPIEHVIDVYDACRQTGLKKVRFAAPADPATTPTP